MPDDLADDLQSMSFGSSERSGSSTVSTGSSGSSSLAPTVRRPHPSPSPSGDPCLDLLRRLRSDGSKPLSLADLRFVHRLGSGDIGSVYLAEVKCADGKGSERCALAAKVMDKRELEGRNKEGRARMEREILEMLDHPFLPRLYGAAENERWSCLLTEFCPGGDLHVLRQRQPLKRFGEHAVRFYAGEVVAAMEYMHMLGIVYRDLKPENVLVRSDGHIMITDFDLSLIADDASSTPAQVISDRHHPPRPANSCGDPLAAGAGGDPSAFSAAACILPSCIVPAVSCFGPKLRRRSRKPGGKRGPALEFVAEPVDLRSMSFVGTHEYLAPEIVSGEGHGSAVDWWTLGVFIFELLYGVTPFRGSDHELTLANIVARALEFPKEPAVTASAKDLISGLLVKDPARRLGSTTGAAAIKRHPFFNGVNWALLRCATPPFVPPPFTIGGGGGGRGGGGSGSGRDLSDDSCPGTPVDYY